jgi:hypothetical protein
MWYLFFGLFYSPSYLRSQWDTIHLQSIEENAQYVDMVTYWLCNTDYIWDQLADKTIDSMKCYMIVNKLNTTSFGNMAYLAIHMKNVKRQKHVRNIYEALVIFKKHSNVEMVFL